MPFKETQKGTTHSFNDGCGEPEHNTDKTLGHICLSGCQKDFDCPLCEHGVHEEIGCEKCDKLENGKFIETE